MVVFEKNEKVIINIINQYVMKKLLLLLVVVLMTDMVWAKTIDQATAAKVAQTFWRQVANSNVPLLDVSYRANFTQIYLFEAADQQGFVFVAADDIAYPILGYSTTSNVGEKLSLEVTYWLDCLEGEILWGLRHGLTASDKISAQWHQLTFGDGLAEPFVTAVSPLCSTTWNQSPYYNALCPQDNSAYGGICPSGCVATAMAQIMKKWNHPTSGIGSHSYTSNYGNHSANFAATTYAWSSMPNSLSSSSSGTQVNAVATLMYHCGVAVEMNYGPNGSSAPSLSNGSSTARSAENAFVRYFNYKNTAHGIYRNGKSPTEWANILKSDLDSGRPVFYTGRDVGGGHAFVCDGYNNSNYFHFNWGWGGSCDGYYPLNALNPSTSGAGGTASGTYNLNQDIIVGIQPNTSTTTTVSVAATSNNTSLGSVSGGGSYARGADVLLTATATAGNRFVRWSDGCEYNPRGFVVNSSTSIQAIFTQVTGDTLQYENGAEIAGFGSPSASSFKWANRFEPSSMVGKTDVSAVMVYTHAGGTFTVKIYQGGSSSPTTLLSTQSFTTQTSGWHTVACNTPIDNTQSLWVVVTNSGVAYPASVSFYSGMPNSSFYTTGSYWYECTNYSFMIRPILSDGSGGGGTGGGCTITSFPWTDGFEGDLSCWHVIDADGDGLNWGVVSQADYVHDGNNAVYSSSYDNDTGPINANNYLLTPSIVLPNSGSYQLSFYARSSDIAYPDSLTVKLTTSTGTLTAASFNQTVLPKAVINTASYQLYTASLSAYAGQTVRIAFIHDSYDGFHILLDDVSITPSSVSQYTITGLPNNTTYGTVSGGGTYSHGDTAVLTAYANGGYRFTQWSDGTLDNPRSVVVSGNATYTAMYANLGTDTIHYDYGVYTQRMGASASNSSISWGVKFNPSDYSNYQQLKQIKIYVTQTGSYTFKVYQGGSSAPSTLLHTQTHTLSASSSWQIVTLSTPVTLPTNQPLWIVVSNTGASHPASCSYYAGCDNSCWVSTSGTSWVPLTDYGFYNSWMLRAVLGQTSSMCTITVNSNNTAWGTVSGGGTYTAGSTATLSATPTAHHNFVRWNDGNTNATRTITVTGDASYTAIFEPTQYTITVSSNNTTMGTVSGGGNFVYGATTVLRATPTNNHRFVSWNDGSTANPRAVTVTGDASYVALFEENTPQMITLNISVNNSAMGYTNPAIGSYSYPVGESITVEAFANSGYQFVKWTSNGHDVFTNSYNLTLTGNTNIIAHFKQNEGIDNVATSLAEIYSNNGYIVVEETSGAMVYIYDVVGRCLSKDRGDIKVKAPASGVYMVKVGDYPAQRVVVVK